MRRCAESVQYRSNPGNMCYIARVLYGVPTRQQELDPTDQESFYLSALKYLDHEVGIDHADHEVGIDHTDHEVGIDHADHEVGIDHADHEVGIDHTDHVVGIDHTDHDCLLYTSPSPRDGLLSRMPSSA